ncbi:MAG: peptidoglycan recognition protein [Actinomycetes bacterium]
MRRFPTALRRRVAIALLLGVGFAILPVPGLSFTEVSVGASEPLPAVTDASAAATAAAVADTDATLGGSKRMIAAADQTSDFRAVGLTFRTRPTAPVLLRTRRADGGWDPWQVLPVSGDDGPNGSPSFGTDPVWVGTAVGYQVNIARPDVASAHVVTVRDQLRRATVDATPLADASVNPPFPAHLRAEWGARAPAGSPRYATTLKLAVVHHSATGNAYTQSQVPSILRSIQAYHMDGRGWSDIAYNFVVDKFGTVWEGRGGGIERPVIGAHAMGFNTSTVGVMVLGDYTQAGVVPSAGALESVSRVIGWKFALHRIDPATRTSFTSGGSTTISAGTVVDLPRVVGHKDVGATGCPGSVYGYLGSIRSRAHAWTTWIRATTEPVGRIETASTPEPGAIQMTGFADDPDIDTPTKVSMSVAGQTVEGYTTIERPDINSQTAFSSFALASGWELVATGVTPGYVEGCVTIIDQGIGTGDVPLGCKAFRVADPAGEAPTGTLSVTAPAAGALTANIRAADPQGPGPYRVDVLVDGVVRSTVETDDAGVGATTIRGVMGGSHKVCARVVNVGAGADTVVDCRSATVPGASPVGRVDLLAVSPTSVRVRGWAFDYESLDPIPVIVFVDQRAVVVSANKPRPDLVTVFGPVGPNHGFDVTIGATRGSHKVCVAARNVGLGRDAAILCKSVVVK